MKRLIIALSLIIFSISGIAQEGNFGFLLGTSYYNGELNPRQQFYMPSPAAGFSYKHNFNKRWSFNINFDYMMIRGNDAKTDDVYQNWRNYAFTSTVWDLGTQVELNFFEFDKENLMIEYFTPYISTGIYLTYIKNSYRPFFPSIPFEFGLKYALTKNITIGASWQQRWTMSDYIDNLQDDNFQLYNKQRNNNPDNDWISRASVFVYIKVFREEMPCPAYGGF